MIWTRPVRQWTPEELARATFLDQALFAAPPGHRLACVITAEHEWQRTGRDEWLLHANTANTTAPNIDRLLGAIGGMPEKPPTLPQDRAKTKS